MATHMRTLGVPHALFVWKVGQTDKQERTDEGRARTFFTLFFWDMGGGFPCRLPKRGAPLSLFRG